MSDVTLNVTCIAPVSPATDGTLTINHGSGTDGSFSLDTNNSLDINVSLGSGITPTNLTYSYQFSFKHTNNTPATSPLSNSSGSNQPLGSSVTVGTEQDSITETLNYTLTITYNGVNYVSDPQIQINPK